MNFEMDETSGLYVPGQTEPHLLGVVKPVGKDVARAEDEFNEHTRKGHLDDSDKVETYEDYETTLAAILAKLRSGNYTHIKAFGGDGTLNVVTNAVKQLAEKITSSSIAASLPAIIAGNFGTVGDGRKSTHGHHFMDDLNIADKTPVPFYPMDMEIWDGDQVVLRRSVVLYSGLNYTARVGAAADSKKWRRRVDAAPWMGKAWSLPVQATMALAQLPGTPEVTFYDRNSDETFTAYDISLLNGERLGGQRTGVGDLRSQSFLELRVPSKRAILKQASRLAIHNYTPLSTPLKNTREVTAVDYEVLDIDGNELQVHFDGQPTKMYQGGRFICRSSGVRLWLVAPMLQDKALARAA